MEEAISSAGSWTWIELANDSIQLEFEDVQLYKHTLEKYSKHSSEIAIRLAGNVFFTIFYNDEKDIIFLEKFDDFSHKVSNDGLKFQNFDFFKKKADSYDFRKTLIGKSFNYNHNSNPNNNLNNSPNNNLNKNNSNKNNLNKNNSNKNNLNKNNSNKNNSNKNNSNENNYDYEMEVDFLLVVVFEDMAIVCGGNQLNFFNDFESLNDEDIKKISNQWWVYWVDYWKTKGTDNEYEYDSACELVPLV